MSFWVYVITRDTYRVREFHFSILYISLLLKPSTTPSIKMGVLILQNRGAGIQFSINIIADIRLLICL